MKGTNMERKEMQERRGGRGQKKIQIESNGFKETALGWRIEGPCFSKHNMISCIHFIDRKEEEKIISVEALGEVDLGHRVPKSSDGSHSVKIGKQSLMFHINFSGASISNDLGSRGNSFPVESQVGGS
jgi:hypothetical protein